MYIVLASAAAFSYALHGTLLAKYLRNHCPLAVIATKGMLISLFLLPEAYYLLEKDPIHLEQFLPVVGFACMLSMLGTWCIAHCLRAFPVGITNALGDCSRTLSAVLIAILFLGESLSPAQLLMITLIIVSAVFLGMSKPGITSETEEVPRSWSGIANSIIFGVLMGISMITMGSIARATHPIVLTFMIELSTGLIAMVPFLIKSVLKNRISDFIHPSKWAGIFLACLPSIAGTCCFCLAAKSGPLAIVSAVLCLGSLLASALAHFIYKEKLSVKQYAIISACCIFIALLKVFES